MLSKKLTEPKNGEKGFTLIELIIVIVILGIIAGVAVPQFIGLTDDAREASASGVNGAMNGTIAGLHAQWLLDGTEYTAQNIVDGTNFGGITPPVVAGNLLTLTHANGDTNTFAYVAHNGDIIATITKN